MTSESLKDVFDPEHTSLNYTFDDAEQNQTAVSFVTEVLFRLEPMTAWCRCRGCFRTLTYCCSSSARFPQLTSAPASGVGRLLFRCRSQHPVGVWGTWRALCFWFLGSGCWPRCKIKLCSRRDWRQQDDRLLKQTGGFRKRYFFVRWIDFSTMSTQRWCISTRITNYFTTLHDYV